MSAISVRNVTRVFRTATPKQLDSGLSWYLSANTIANALGETHGIGVHKAAGVLAALSPLRSWADNVNLGARFIAAGGLTEGAFALSLGKAQAILDGADILKTLNGNKTKAFYACIATNGLTDLVCIDRHAYDVATNTRHTDTTRVITDKRYKAAVSAYNGAAVILSRELGYPVSGAQVQAVTWLAWRARYWNDGAFDVKE